VGALEGRNQGMGETSPDENVHNAAVARVIPANRLVDRTTDMTFLEDGTHLDDASQRLLAARAAAALGCE
jgi:hypothetical protein